MNFIIDNLLYDLPKITQNFHNLIIKIFIAKFHFSAANYYFKIELIYVHFPIQSVMNKGKCSSRTLDGTCFHFAPGHSSKASTNLFEL